MNVFCPHCAAVYRVDPARVPPAGVRARCSRCSGVFPVAGAAGRPSLEERPEPAGTSAFVAAGPAATSAQPAVPTPAAPVPTAPAAAAAPAQEEARPARPRFGTQDPAARARRIARALVSDIVAYHPDRRERALREGTLRMEFKDEILKSWNEYVEQVGDETARQTPHFRDALNDVLAQGQKVF